MSCSNLKENLDVEQDREYRYSNIVLTIPESIVEDSELQTKNTAISNEDGSKWTFVWAQNDTIGIFPDNGSQIYFSMASGAGQVSASFDGGGWALKKGSSYYSYFPFTPDFYINKEAVPLTYVGQVQTGNADPNIANLGKYGYMLAKGVADESTGSLYFNYEKLGCLSRAKIPVSKGTYNSLKVYTESDVLVQSGTFNAVEMSMNIDNPVFSNSLTINFEELSFEESGILYAFFMMAPFNYENKQITLELLKSDGTREVSSVRGKLYERGQVYGMNSHLNISPAFVEISGSSGVFTFDILTFADYEYSVVSSDPTWLIPSIETGRGTTTVSVTAEKNEGGKRTGHITVSETVNGVELKNVVNVTQYPDGFNVAITGWNDSDVDYGGVAQPS